MFQLLHGAAMTEDKAPLSLRTGSLVAETSMTGGMNGIDRQKIKQYKLRYLPY
jgi:hypothetical protein